MNQTSHPITKLVAFIGMTLVAMLITGCVVTSIYPFYRDKDVSSDPALLGKWIAESETNSATAGEFWTFENINARTLKLTTVDGGKTNAYDAVLFQLGGARFLDCLFRERHEMHAPGHILLRVESLSPELKVSPLNYDWLERLVAEKPRAIRHIFVPNEAGATTSAEDLMLTADTAELQKFILKHLKNDEAWCKPIVMKR